MNRQSFQRKVLYLVAIAGLLFPLFLLGEPATIDAGGGGQKGGPGGKLARLREAHELSQANLGEVDPAGEAIRLATLGLRGLAAVILWEQANDAKDKEDWTRLDLTLEQLKHVQPNYVGVWRFQAWNQSYNVSSEWDDFHDRYYWVMKGIGYLDQGTRYNKHEISLVTDIGDFLRQKIGHSDERRQFRELFRKEDPFLGKSRTVDQRDCWLVAKEYYLRAQEMYENQGSSLGKRSELLFYNDRPMCQMKFAEALADEGAPSDKVQRAWQAAEREWLDYGNRSFSDHRGNVYRLNEYDAYLKDAHQAVVDLDALTPGVRQRLRDEKKAKLPESVRKALVTEPKERDEDTNRTALLAEADLLVPHSDVARAAEPDKRELALKAAQKAIDLENKVHSVDTDRGLVKYSFWLTYSRMEASDDALLAHRLMFEGRKAFKDADLPAATSAYERGFALWKKVLDQYPNMYEEAATSDWIDEIENYRQVLNQQDLPFPKDFPLRKLLDLHPRAPHDG